MRLETTVFSGSSLASLKKSSGFSWIRSVALTVGTVFAVIVLIRYVVLPIIGYLAKKSAAPQPVRRAAGIIYDQVYHRPHPLHDQKYRSALENFREEAAKFVRVNFQCSVEEFRVRFPQGERLNALLDDLFLEQGKPIRKQTSDFVDHLRAIISSEEYQQGRAPRELVAFVRYLCGSKFLKHSMRNYLIRLLTDCLRSAGGAFPAPDRLSAVTIATHIEQLNGCLRAVEPDLRKTYLALAAQKLRGQLGVGFEPTGKGPNIPYVRSVRMVTHRGAVYPVIVMRHGTPTYDTLGDFFRRRVGMNTVKVIPEYETFLANGLPVLYVNLQKMASPGPERDRSVKIQELGERHQNFSFAALPVDGPVIDRIEEGTTQEWIDSLCAALFQERDGFHLPRVLRGQEEVGEQLRLLAADLHRLYFSGADLAREDRLNYLMIFYSHVKDVFCERLGTRAIVSSCKDNKDRGGASSSVDEALQYLRESRENDPEALNNLLLAALAPYMIKYERIIPDRLELFLRVLRHLGRLSEAQKQAIREHRFVPGYEVRSQIVMPLKEEIPDFFDLRVAAAR